jgi:hypothetical protein
MASEREMDQSSFASLLGGAISDIRELFRQEVNLARVEIRQEVANAKAAAIKIGIAAVALLMGTLLLLTALARGVSDLFDWPVWAGHALVGALLAVVGGALFAMARPNLKAVGPVPARTMRTMKENVEWVKRETS